jgi:hypothetical protein
MLLLESPFAETAKGRSSTKCLKNSWVIGGDVLLAQLVEDDFSFV